MKETVFDYQTGERREVETTSRVVHPAFKVEPKLTREVYTPKPKYVAPAKPVKVAKPVKDEAAEVLAYYNERMKLQHGPADTRTPADRLRDRIASRVERASEVTRAEAVKAEAKRAASLVGKSWTVGGLRATIISDDGSVCRYKFGQFGETRTICRNKAIAQLGKGLRTVNAEACDSNRAYESAEPTTGKHTADFRSVKRHN